jgi:hypothetical protein
MKGLDQVFACRRDIYGRNDEVDFAALVAAIEQRYDNTTFELSVEMQQLCDMAHAEIDVQREFSGKVSEKQMKALRHISCYGREVASDFPSLVAVIEQQQNEVALKVPGVVGG